MPTVFRLAATLCLMAPLMPAAPALAGPADWQAKGAACIAATAPNQWQAECSGVIGTACFEEALATGQAPDMLPCFAASESFWQGLVWTDLAVLGKARPDLAADLTVTQGAWAEWSAAECAFSAALSPQAASDPAMAEQALASCRMNLALQRAVRLRGYVGFLP